MRLYHCKECECEMIKFGYFVLSVCVSIKSSCVCVCVSSSSRGGQVSLFSRPPPSPFINLDSLKAIKAASEGLICV